MRETSSGPTGAPSIETMRSPAASPIVSAGVPGETESTVVVALPPEVMNSPAKRASASTMFAAGPAKMTSTRFHVFARQ